MQLTIVEYPNKKLREISKEVKVFDEKLHNLLDAMYPIMIDTLTINYQDRNGNTKILEADGLLSIAIQHEMDHLEGILFIDKLSYGRRKKFEKEYKRMLKEKKSS